MNAPRQGNALNNGQAVVNAIDQVLRLQEQSREIMRAAHVEAEQRLLRAREEARLIEARADRRISRIQKEYSALVRKRVDALLTSERLKAARARDAGVRPDVAELARRLAAQLTQDQASGGEGAA